MSDQEAAIRARLAAATPGPWSWEDWDGAPPSDDPCDKNSLAARPETRRDGGSKWFPNLGNELFTDEDGNLSEADKAFIAHAPDDITFLLSALSSQREELERLTKENAGLGDAIVNLVVLAKKRGEAIIAKDEEIAKLTAENAALIEAGGNLIALAAKRGDELRRREGVDWRDSGGRCP